MISTKREMGSGICECASVASLSEEQVKENGFLYNNQLNLFMNNLVSVS